MQEIICEKCAKCGTKKTNPKDSFTSFKTDNMKNAVCLCGNCVNDIAESALLPDLEVSKVIEWTENFDRENS